MTSQPPADQPAAQPTPPQPRSMLSLAVRGRHPMGRIPIHALGLPRRLGDDVYHRLMQSSWPRLLGLFVGVFLSFNLIFALIYLADPGGVVSTRDEAAIAPFLRDFFFSVHTVATIGYGNMYAADLYTNGVVVIEIILGIVYFALTTGIAFARFSRPTARILFSKVMVVREIDGVPTLMLRAANQRHNMLYSAEARVSVLVDGEVGGVAMRRFVDLELVRASNPAFALTWVMMHRIDEHSPLAGWLASGRPDAQADVIVILSGTDEVSGQLVHGRWAYGAEDIVWGARFVDIIRVGADGVRTIDYRHFHDVTA